MKNAISPRVKCRNRTICLTPSYLGPAVMEFNTELTDWNLICQKVRDDIVFTCFDVHFQQINVIMAEQPHNARKSIDRTVNLLSAALDGRIRNVRRIRWGMEGHGSVEVSNTIIVDENFGRNVLSSDPLKASWRGVKGVNVRRESLHALQIKGNICPNSERVDHTGRSQQFRVDAKTCIPSPKPDALAAKFWSVERFDAAYTSGKPPYILCYFSDHMA